MLPIYAEYYYDNKVYNMVSSKWKYFSSDVIKETC